MIMKIRKPKEIRQLILFALFFVIVFYFVDLKVFDKLEIDESDWDNKISVGGCEFRLEFVRDDESRRMGLSNRDSLCDECGMLFEFPEKDVRTFCMKNMRFDLDIVWISDNKIVGIEKDVSRYLKGTISSPEEVNKVLEINAGKSEECNIKNGLELKYVD